MAWLHDEWLLGLAAREVHEPTAVQLLLCHVPDRSIEGDEIACFVGSRVQCLYRLLITEVDSDWRS
jgi:hypothetical protein